MKQRYLSEFSDNIIKRVAPSKARKYMKSDEYMMYCYLGTSSQDYFMNAYINELILTVLEKLSRTNKR